MPFYIRKSISAGPFRFNLSNSGVGVSVGVKGLRIGTGPRGHYVRAGLGGLYYRASLNGLRNSSTPQNASPRPRFTNYTDEDRVTMIEVRSSDVSGMRDPTVADLIDDLNKKQAQIRFGVAAAICLAVLGGVLLLQFNFGGQIVCATIGGLALAAALPAWILGEWFDSYKRTTVLFYDLQETTEVAYRKVVESFDALTACHGKWQIISGGAVRDLRTWKRNAGAAHLIDRKRASLNYALPRVLRSNVTPPTITLSGRTFYFLPEVMLVKQGGRFGAVSYDHLKIWDQTSRFIEDRAPSDAQVVGYTWKHPNKGGGPDRRFRDNRQLPICLYDVMHLSSGTGVNELLEFSRTGLVHQFSTALYDLPRKQAREGDPLRLGDTPTFSNDEVVVPKPRQAGQRLGLKFLVGTAALISVVAILAAYEINDGDSPVSTGIVGSMTAAVSHITMNTTQKRASDTNATTPEPTSAPVQPATSSLPVVTVKITANVRSAPGTSSTIVRVANIGEKFEVFGRSSGWVEVGGDQPIGWIAASLLTK